MVYIIVGFFHLQFSNAEVVNGMILNRNTSFMKSIKREVLSVSLTICKQVLLLVGTFSCVGLWSSGNITLQ